MSVARVSSLFMLLALMVCAPAWAAPGPPRDLRATPGVERVTLTWKRVPSKRVTGYAVHRRRAGERDTTLARMRKPRYVDRSVAPGVVHHYRVAVRVRSRRGKISEAVAVVPHATTFTPLPVADPLVPPRPPEPPVGEPVVTPTPEPTPTPTPTPAPEPPPPAQRQGGTPPS